MTNKKNEDILDLDALIGETKKIKFGGKTYEVGDVPMGIVLKLKDESVENMFEVFGEILEPYNPEFDRKELEKLTGKQIKKLTDYIFGEINDPEVKKKDDESIK